MTSDDFDEFSKIVVAFAELKGKELSTPAQKLYFRALKHWSLSEVKRAAEHLLRTCEFMPTPKNFEDLRKAARPDVAEAWEQAKRFAHSLWHPKGYRDGSIGDRAIDLAVGTLGGYPVIAMCDTDKLQWLEKRFREAYDGTSEAQNIRAALPVVAREHAKLLADLATPKGSGFARIAASAPAPVALPAPVVAPTPPKVALPPPPSAREKIAKLLPLGMDDDAIAKVAGESVEVVREVRAEQECEA